MQIYTNIQRFHYIILGSWYLSTISFKYIIVLFFKYNNLMWKYIHFWWGIDRYIGGGYEGGSDWYIDKECNLNS